MRINTKVVAIVLLVAAATIAAATIATFAQQRRMESLQAQLTETQTKRAELATQLDAALTELETLKASQETTVTDDDSDLDDDSSSSDGSDDSSDATQKRFAFVTDAFVKDSTVWLVLDYAEFLTDPDAIKEATEKSGDDYPPPNDYYIYNPSSTTTKLQVDDSAKFIIKLTGPDDTEKLTPEKFVAAFEKNTDQVADVGYWVTIDGDTIERVEEQWTP